VLVPADVLALLGEQAEAVRRDPAADPLDRARTVAVLAGLALRAMDAADGRERLAALEQALGLRAAERAEQARRAKAAGKRT